MVKEKSAIVIGSTSGIGLAIAEALAAYGANIVLNGRGSDAKNEPLRAEFERRHGVKAIYDNADMTKPAQIEAMVTRAVSEFGSVDILVNNVGIQFVSPVEEFPVEKWGAIIAINMSSAFHTIRAALPGMKTKAWGRIINIASAYGLVASPFKSAYVAAKHGLEQIRIDANQYW